MPIYMKIEKGTAKNKKWKIKNENKNRNVGNQK